jgi:hypothetical protein
MDLVRKWCWLILLGVAIGVGIVYFRNLGSIINQRNTTGGTAVSSGKTQVQAGNKLVAVEKQVTGEVVSWDSSKAELTFKLKDSGKTVAVNVVPGQTAIFIPVAQHKTNTVLPISSKADKNWSSAFCPQDTLTVGYDSSGVVKMLFNTGYRMCGFRGNQ